jgi:hypothetical protein
VEDAGEAVGEAAESVVVLVAVSPLLVVEGPCAFGDAQGGEGLAVEGVDEAGVADEPGGYELPLAGGAGDGAARRALQEHGRRVLRRMRAYLDDACNLIEISSDTLQVEAN